MKQVSIQAEGLSKRYRIGLEEAREITLAGVIRSWITSPLSKFRDLRRLSHFENDDDDVVWALNGVSFEIRPGEVVGIIGRNGAGKTTLLKVLSRITEPTRGRAVIHGRVASLISVGTGFHGELTGRENVFLNGAILGMSKQEIVRKFDEIVAFSGVERFIDTPVKRYSSGMYVRLGFAVAAHLEPDVLLVDEVLAVGDAAFQRKCLGKMEDVAQEGRTVVFISHNMQLVERLCPRTLLLEDGAVAADGPTARVIERYLNERATSEVSAETSVEDFTHRRGSGKVRFTRVKFRNGADQEQYRFRSGEAVRFELTYRVNEPVDGLMLRFVVGAGKSGETLGVVRRVVTLDRLEAGAEGTLVLELPSLPFNPGIYPLRFEVRTPEPESDAFDHRLSYDVLHDLTSPLVVIGDREDRDHGIIDLDARLVRPRSFSPR